MFDTILGASPMNAIDPTFFGFDTSLFLRVWFSPDGVSFNEMLPQQKLVSSPSALNADMVDGYHAADLISLATNSVTLSGDISGTPGDGTTVDSLQGGALDLGAGGVAFASSGAVKLGASLDQNGLMFVATNADGHVFLNGFWKAEDACTLYNPTITELVRATNGMAITFLVVNSNTYSVSYIEQEQGGLLAGTGAITNPVLTLEGLGAPGATTTIWHNVSASTNRALFYLIRCE